MLFSSITFIYVFLPAVLLACFLLPGSWRNGVLLLASVTFYAFGEPRCLWLLLLSSLLAWGFGLLAERFRGGRGAKIALICGLGANLALLGFFKYADFVVESCNALLGTALPMPRVPLPLGISFFTFQAMSYLVDVYRGETAAERNPFRFSTFLCLFPQLVAGPIVRYTDVAEDLRGWRRDWTAAGEGLSRFACGLAKKVLLANALGQLCALFRGTEEKTVLFTWLYALAFTLQIYYDFSGYSDMAIGLGRMLGFRFPENFNYPLFATSVTDFWRRWHMTLSGWFRDYVYIPLGGSRVGPGRWLVNIAAVWLLTGLWHGAAWNFVLWGGLYGLLLAVEKLFLQKLLQRLGPVLPRLYVLGVTMVGFVLFNAAGLSGAVADLGGLVGVGGVPLWDGLSLYYLASYLPLLLAALVGASPLVGRQYGQLSKRIPLLPPLLTAAAVLLSTAALVEGSFNPFLYFRF